MVKCDELLDCPTRRFNTCWMGSTRFPQKCSVVLEQCNLCWQLEKPAQLIDGNLRSSKGPNYFFYRSTLIHIKCYTFLNTLLGFLPKYQRAVTDVSITKAELLKPHVRNAVLNISFSWVLQMNYCWFVQIWPKCSYWFCGLFTQTSQLWQKFDPSPPRRLDRVVMVCSDADNIAFPRSF